jgi:hypothetical protein
VLLEEGTDRGGVGLAGRGVGCPGAAEVEKAVDRIDEEGGEVDRDDVGGRVVR